MAAVPGDAAAIAELVGQSGRAPLQPGERRWQVLTPVHIDVGVEDAARRHAMATLAPDIPTRALETYRPIAWHTDLLSGYTWDPTQFYLDVRVAPVAGADIKFPRELSRFQHIGALAMATPPQASALEFLLQVVDWIAANPARRGVNWACTMDVGLRALSWVWGLRLFEAGIVAYPAALRAVGSSLQAHGRHIENNLEYYEESTSNHYLSNVAGLLYVGAAIPNLPESDRWLLLALQELVSEMERQVYEDGADYEASTHYHRFVAELFVSCAALAERVPAARRARLARINIASCRTRPRLRPPRESGLNLGAVGALLPAAFYQRLARMAEFTGALTKPNGLVPQFGDNDSARAHKLAPCVGADVRDHRHLLAVTGELLDRSDLAVAGADAAIEGRILAGGLRGRIPTPAPRVDIGAPVIEFPVAGIAILRRGPSYLAITCGPNGLGGRGGHGHNDKNSFELNVHGLDFIVDGGCPVYTAAPDIRNRYRSTAAHNTVSVEGAEQDAWPPGAAGLFKLPERSSPRLRVARDGTIEATHAGFGPVHVRTFRLAADRLIVQDHLADPRTRSIAFNLDPAISLRELSARAGEVHGVLVHANGTHVTLAITGASDPQAGAGTFSVGYGMPIANTQLRVRMLGPDARTELSW